MSQLEGEALYFVLFSVNANREAGEAVGEVGGVNGDAAVGHFLV